jgi:hypothetical protein
MADNNQLQISDLVEIEIKKRLSASGRRAGKARLTSMTAEERKRIARLAAKARWAKKPEAPDPNDPKGTKPDQQPRPGIMSSQAVPSPARY